MSLLGMKYFLVAAEELNFTAAAKRLYVTQQTLSAHIRRLEQEYQVTLFGRKPRLHLTPEGERMVKYATRIIRLERVMSAEFADLDRTSKGVLSLGISRMRARLFFSRIWDAYRKQFPNIEIHLSEAAASTLEKLLASHKADMCIGIEIRPAPALHRIPLLRETVHLAVPKELFRAHYGENAAAAARAFAGGVPVERLPDLPLLLPPSVNRIRRLLDQQFDSVDRIARPVFESNDQELLISMCESGVGQAFLPASSLFYAPPGPERLERIYAFPLRGLEIETVLGYPADLEPPHYAQAFLQSCRAVFEDAGEQIRRRSAEYLETL